jgi:hypothetical protein
MSQFPTLSACKFLLCDDVRSEHDGKIMLWGWYPDNQILCHPPSAPLPDNNVFLLSGISFVIALMDGEGEFALRMVLRGPPDGKEFFDQPAGQARKERRRPHTFTFRFAPFAHSSFGQFTVVLYLGDRPYEFAFDVHAVASPVNIPAPTSIN